MIIPLWLGKKMSVLLEKHNEECRDTTIRHLELMGETKCGKILIIIDAGRCIHGGLSLYFHFADLNSFN